MTGDGSHAKEVDHRIAKAWAAFNRHRQLLTNKDAPLKDRFFLLDLLVSRSAFWCLGTLNLTEKDLVRLTGAQRAMAWSMIGPKRKQGELDDFLFPGLRRGSVCFCKSTRLLVGLVCILVWCSTGGLLSFDTLLKILVD